MDNTGCINASSVSSIKPPVVETLETVLFFKLYFGLKNKIKNAPTRNIVMITLNILFIVYEYYLRRRNLGLTLVFLDLPPSFHP